MHRLHALILQLARRMIHAPAWRVMTSRLLGTRQRAQLVDMLTVDPDRSARADASAHLYD